MKREPAELTDEAVANLLSYLGSHLGLSPEFYSAIEPMLEGKILTSKLQVIKQGGVCRDAFWLNRGYIRCYNKTVDNYGMPIETTIDFCGAGRIFVIPECFFNDQPCSYDVEIANGSVIVPFTKDYFNALKLCAPEAEALANNILSLEKLEGLKKMEMIKMKPRPRYREFIRILGKDVELFFSVKHIASYLGMQPSYLSRLRSEIRKKRIIILDKVSVVTFLLFEVQINLLFN
jgi:CRP-like cAMP-binding protein